MYQLQQGCTTYTILHYCSLNYCKLNRGNTQIPKITNKFSQVIIVRINTLVYNILHCLEGRWKNVCGEDLESMPRYETLTWLALWRLVLNPELNNHYEINNFRKTQLCKVRYIVRRIEIKFLP